VAADGMKIPLSRPDITAVERRAVLDVLESSNLSLGPKLSEFEQAMAKYVGVRHAVAVNSGTSGLHLIVRALGIGPGNEVITTPFSFIASANCVVVEGARPVFVDIDPETYNIDVAKIEHVITPKTKAILGVDVFGRCADWERIEAIAQLRRLAVIEDSCEALGAESHGRKAGSFGDAGCFGFYPNKQMTTGEGGMILTDRDDLVVACRSMRNQGREDGEVWLQHSRLGFNYRISDLNCALGLAQLSRLEDMLARRAALAALYLERLRAIEDVVLPPPVKEGRLSWFVFVVRLADRYSRADRDRVLQGLREAGIGCSNYFPPIHLQTYYVERFGHRPGDFPVTERVAERTIALPFFNALTAARVDEVVDCLDHQIHLLGDRR
jgi:dTDP-4-amino-4,6-dideoxygalactose transaminase